jgi:hypothetical protein
MSPYRQPPRAPGKPKKTPWLRLLWARLRGLQYDLLVRADRHWWASRYPRASWAACQRVAELRCHGGAEGLFDRLEAEECMAWEHNRGYYQPGLPQRGPRVSREEHERWIREGVNPTYRP